MDKFEKYIGKGKIIKIGEDEFCFKPLNIEDLKDYFALMKKFEGAEEKDFLERLDAEASNLLTKLVMKMLKISYPERDEELLSQFAMNNLGILMATMFEVNSLGGTTPDVKEKLAQLRGENVQPAGNPPKT